MLTVLCGKTCSGKDTISNELINTYGFKRIITYTTRPKRKNEIDGETYYYISQEEFHKKVEEGFFAEWKMYTTANGVWCYGTALHDLNNTSDAKYILILTPNGYREIRNKVKCKMKCVYLYANNNTIKKRLTQRGDDVAEAMRRIEHDNMDFKDFEYEADKIYYNNDGTSLETVIQRIAEFVG